MFCFFSHLLARVRTAQSNHPPPPKIVVCARVALRWTIILPLGLLGIAWDCAWDCAWDLYEIALVTAPVGTRSQVYFVYTANAARTWQDPRFMPKNWEQRIDANGRLHFAVCACVWVGGWVG